MRSSLLLMFAFATYASAGTISDPFTGVPLQINGTPGATTQWEAENFDRGGEGVAYHDPNNCGAVPQVPSVLAPPVAPALPGDAQKPAIPTGLVAVAVSPTQVNLTWNASTDNVGVTGYWVYLNDQGFVRVTSTSYTHGGLTPGTTYNYRVSAYDAANNQGDWTAVVPVTTPLTAKACSCPPGAYRPDGVNVCTTGTVTYISYDDAGLWVEYTIQVAAVGDYTVELLVAFAQATCCAAAAYHVELDGAVVTKSVALGPTLTAGWTSFEWRGKSELIGMIPGVHHLRIVVDKPWFNWDSIRVKFAAGIEWQQVPVWKVYP